MFQINYDRETIIHVLQERTKIKRIGLPRDIDFSINQGALKVYINNPAQNMQTNAASFESWILALKSWLPDMVSYVKLDFAQPGFQIGETGKSEACHFNRFLYRLFNMQRLFPDWFVLDESKQGIVIDFVHWVRNSTCLLNHSLRERQSVIETDKMERQIESWLVFEEGKKTICDFYGIDGDKLFNQLPIGVFSGEIASKNAVFTRGASAIDIWGVGKDQTTFHLIELKRGSNSGIGVLSEILFYAFVVYDTCIAHDSFFSFGRYGSTPDTKDLRALKNEGNKFGMLMSHILSENFHPLLNENVVALTNEGLAHFNITLDKAKYSYGEKAIYESKSL